MTTAAAETAKEVVTEAATAAGETAGNAVASVVAAAETAVAAAEAERDAAQEVAEKITEAAMRDEIVGMVEDVQEEFETWRGAHDATHASLQTQIETLTGELNSLKAQLAALTPPAPTPGPEASLIPPHSTAEVTTGDQPAIIEPAAAAAAEAMPAAPEVRAKRPGRFL